MKIQIKKALLEGHTPDVIVEAVHANHPELSKKNSLNTRPRKRLANELGQLRRERDEYRKDGQAMYANNHDNYARFRSSTGAFGEYSRDPMHNITGASIRTGIKRISNDPNIVNMEKNNELHTGLKIYLPSYNRENQKVLEDKMMKSPRTFASAKQ